MKVSFFLLIIFAFFTLVLGIILVLGELPTQSTLASELNEVETYISDRDRVASDVSSVDVAWHIDHLLKVINGIHYSLGESDPGDYKYSWKFMRSVVFGIGRFPRGVAESPKSVLPPDEIDTDDMYKQLEDARLKLMTFSKFDKHQHFHHPEFGVLNRDRALKLVVIHTRHHLRIIRDIVRTPKKDEAASK